MKLYIFQDHSCFFYLDKIKWKPGNLSGIALGHILVIQYEEMGPKVNDWIELLMCYHLFFRLYLLQRYNLGGIFHELFPIEPLICGVYSSWKSNQCVTINLGDQ